MESGLLRTGQFAVFGQEPGDTEVQQLHVPVRPHQDVGGLQVAMHDQVLLRVIDRVAHREEEPQPFIDREPARIAPPVDAFAIHVFHRQERQTFGRESAVEQLRDVRMSELREDLPLADEPGFDLGIDEPLPDHLDRHLLLVVIVHAAPSEVDGREPALAERSARLERRATRLAGVLEGSTIRTEDEAFNRAFAWARLSLDALAVEDSTAFHLVAGIPGTDAPAGRSTLTALDGALLATGQWEDARRMLLTYGRAQRRDRRIDYFGRIPNTFVGGRPQYTTVDATPIFVAAVGDYLRTTGDRGIITSNGAEFWTRTVYAVRGLFEDTATPDGYLRNAEGQTWVQPFDGRGRTARVNRAAEVQGRLYRALRAMQPIARIMGQISGRPTSAAAYGDSAAALQRRFERDFVEDERIADVLTPTGAPSERLRPSGLLALRDFDLGPEAERRILRRTASGLAYPHGVATRSQTDSLFHPYLHADDYYEPDAARYEGTVWTWLGGPLASLLADRTVVTYDPRGIGRSVRHDGVATQTPQQQADARRDADDAVRQDVEHGRTA